MEWWAAIKLFVGARKWLKYAIIYGLPLAAAVFCTWTVLDWRSEAQKVAGLKKELATAQADLKAAEDEKKRQNNISFARLKKVQLLTQGNDLLTESLKNEISKNSVYRSCIIPAGGVRAINQAIKARD